MDQDLRSRLVTAIADRYEALDEALSALKETVDVSDVTFGDSK